MDVELVLPPEPVRLVPGADVRVPVAVRNTTAGPVAIRVSVAGGRAAEWARAEPPDLAVAAAGSADLALIFRAPARSPAGAALIPFTVRADEASGGDRLGWVTGLLSLGGDPPPLLTVREAGTSRPRLSARAAALGTVLLFLVTAAIVLIGARVGLPGRDPAPAPAPTDALRRPFVLLDVFPHRGADGGRGAAEAERDRLAAAGMPVRLVDSLATDQLSDDQGGFWVVLQDGFGSAAQAQAYCDRFRATAPKCRIAP